jgi:uncharacterized membrane protein YbhN (UPF0104 family)
LKRAALLAAVLALFLAASAGAALIVGSPRADSWRCRKSVPRDLECDGRLPDRLWELAWGALALGICGHVLRLLAVSRAWRNIIKGAYPQARVRWRSIVGSVFAGVGVNAIIPARGGEAVRVVLAKRSVEGSSYATIASTLVLLSLFDFVVATCLVIWAAVTGQLPQVLGPSFDFSWAFHNPGTFLKVVAVVLAVAVVIVLWFAEQIGDFRRRLTQGFAILKDRRAYLQRVAFWQGIDWTLRLIGVLFFLHAFGLPVTVHNALLVQVSAGLASLLPITPSGSEPSRRSSSTCCATRRRGRLCSRSASACGSRSSSSTSCSASRALHHAADRALAPARGYDFDRPRYSMSVPDPGSDPLRSVPSPSQNCYARQVRGLKAGSSRESCGQLVRGLTPVRRGPLCGAARRSSAPSSRGSRTRLRALPGSRRGSLREPKCWSSARRRAGPTPWSVSKIDSFALSRAAAMKPEREAMRLVADPLQELQPGRVPVEHDRLRRSGTKTSSSRFASEITATRGRSNACIAANTADNCPLPPSTTTRFGVAENDSSYSSSATSRIRANRREITSASAAKSSCPAEPLIPNFR